MSSSAILRRGLNQSGQPCFAAIDDLAMEKLKDIPVGDDVEVTWHRRRNPSHHRLFFALLREVIDGGGWEGDEESLLLWLKARLGLVEAVDLGPYGERLVLKSISFASMGQDRFRAFFDRAVHVLLTERMGLDDEARDRIVASLEERYRDPREAA